MDLKVVSHFFTVVERFIAPKAITVNWVQLLHAEPVWAISWIFLILQHQPVQVKNFHKCLWYTHMEICSCCIPHIPISPGRVSYNQLLWMDRGMKRIQINSINIIKLPNKIQNTLETTHQPTFEDPCGWDVRFIKEISTSNYCFDVFPPTFVNSWIQILLHSFQTFSCRSLYWEVNSPHFTYARCVSCVDVTKGWKKPNMNMKPPSSVERRWNNNRQNNNRSRKLPCLPFTETCWVSTWAWERKTHPSKQQTAAVAPLTSRTRIPAPWTGAVWESERLPGQKRASYKTHMIHEGAVCCHVDE